MGRKSASAVSSKKQAAAQTPTGSMVGAICSTKGRKNLGESKTKRDARSSDDTDTAVAAVVSEGVTTNDVSISPQKRKGLKYGRPNKLTGRESNDLDEPQTATTQDIEESQNQTDGVSDPFRSFVGRNGIAQTNSPAEEGSSGDKESALVVASEVQEICPSELPTAENWDLQEAEEKREERQRKTNAMTTTLFGLGVALVAGLILIFVYVFGGKSSDTTLSPTPGPTGAPTPSPEEYLISLLPDASVTNIRRVDSPQWSAFQWLLNDTSLNTYPRWRAIQRFSMASVFYATGGETTWRKSTNWLSVDPSVHECDWYNEGNTFLMETPNGTFLYPSPSSCFQEHVEYLGLNENGLTGSLPEELYLLTSLRNLSPELNDLEGDLSTLIGKLSSLEQLSLAGNKMVGSLPSELGLLKNLTLFLVSHNNFSGEIPTELGEIDCLKYLWLDMNYLEATLPSELGLLKNMHSLVLQDIKYATNSISGPIASELGLIGSEAEYLELFLHNCTLTGTIPTELGQLSNMENFIVGANELQGILPTELGMWSSAKFISPFGNFLSGSIPSEIGLCESLRGLSIRSNNLSGVIPSEVGQLRHLEYLDLYENVLTGGLISEIGLLSAMTDLQMFGNPLGGSLPSQIGLLSNLWKLWLFESGITGTLPTEIGNLSLLQDLSLEYNFLSSVLPSELALLTKLEYLFIQGNDLTGTIPLAVEFLATDTSTYDLPLLMMDISENDLSGIVPEGLCHIGDFNFNCTDILCGCDCRCVDDASNATIETEEQSMTVSSSSAPQDSPSSNFIFPNNGTGL